MNKLKYIIKKISDLRFIQFIFTFLTWHNNKYGNDGFYLEEKECLKKFKEFILDMDNVK